MSETSLSMDHARARVKREMEEFAWMFSYLALYLCTLATYSLLLWDQPHAKVFTYGLALFNAFVLTKVIMIGRMARLGMRTESKPLIVSATTKAVLFGLLAMVMHGVEEMVRSVVKGEAAGAMFHGVRIEDVVIRNLVVIAGLIPFFAFFELRRVLGERRFADLFFRTGRALDASSARAA